MVWSFIWLVIIVYGFFNGNFSSGVNQIGMGESSRYGALSNSYNEKAYDISNNNMRKKNNRKNGFSGIYIIFLISNIIGYLHHMQ
jgi:hypothetical protein